MLGLRMHDELGYFPRAQLRESLALGEFGARAVAEVVFLETVPR